MLSLKKTGPVPNLNPASSCILNRDSKSKGRYRPATLQIPQIRNRNVEASLSKIIVNPSTESNASVFARQTLSIVSDVHDNTPATLNTISDKTCPTQGDGIDITSPQE
jgi:hypothetical protein